MPTNECKENKKEKWEKIYTENQKLNWVYDKVHAVQFLALHFCCQLLKFQTSSNFINFGVKEV